jgi:hypothetical protein
VFYPENPVLGASEMTERVRLEYLLVPHCDRAREYVDPFYTIVPEGDPESITDCPRCGLPRWIPVEIDIGAYSFNTIPINDDGRYAPKFDIPGWGRATGLRIEVARTGSKWQPSPVADLRFCDGSTATSVFELEPAIQCKCLDNHDKNQRRSDCCGKCRELDV